MNVEITQKQKLLNAEGDIATPGFGKTLIWDYHKKDVRASSWRLKEWDYYYIGNNSHALALTVSDMGYVGAISVTVLDFVNKTQVTKTLTDMFVFGKYNMPETTLFGDVDVTIGKSSFKFLNYGQTRKLVGVYSDFGGKNIDLNFDVVLTHFPKESMVIATPFDKKKYFYYNQKINCMRAIGEFSIGEKKFLFEKDSGALATLDWGRGVWTYSNTWYWGSLQTILPTGKSFGFNIGYGFGNTTNATENMLFYDGLSHKLDEVEFIIPTDDKDRDDYMKDWQFTSNDGRFEMSFKPIIDRTAPLNLLVLKMIPHQVFGLFSGNVTLDDGTVIEIKDTLGFAEKVHNCW